MAGSPGRAAATRIRATALLAGLLAGCVAAGPSQPPATATEPPLPTPAATSAPSAPAPTRALPTNVATAPTQASGTWTLQVPGDTVPPAREDHTWTVDPTARVAYLFGGRAGGTVFEDLWAFDLTTDSWTKLSVEGLRPAGRFGHEAAWIGGLGLVVTLGQAGARFFDDVWLFDPDAGAWRELPGNGERPVARYGSCSGIGRDGRLWISHGFTAEGSRFYDTRAYDFDHEAWSDESPADLHPVERCLHACWFTESGDFVLYGGQTTGLAALGDLWRLGAPQSDAAGTWTKLPAPDLAARHLPAVARRDGATIVFGGRDVDRKPLGDLWVLPDRSSSPSSPVQAIGASPSPRSGAAFVYDAPGDRLLLFGGVGDAELDDLWALSFD